MNQYGDQVGPQTVDQAGNPIVVPLMPLVQPGHGVTPPAPQEELNHDHSASIHEVAPSARRATEHKDNVTLLEDDPRSC